MTTYFFTDLHLLNTQTNAQAYGPVSGALDTEYRVTSVHSTSGSAKAYAVVDGRVFAQETGNASTINLILEPHDQGGIGFAKIKYFIYRGVVKSSLVNGAGTGIQSPAQNDLAQLIIDAQAARNDSFDQANGNNQGTTTDQPSSKALGIHYAPASPLPDQRLDSDTISSIFHNESGKYQAQPVKAGDSLGAFQTTLGFEIVLETSGVAPTLAIARSSENKVTAAAPLANPTPLQRLQNYADREAILRYLDPTVFYGMQYPGKIKYWDSNSNKQSKSGNAIYDDILTKFYRPDVVYLDIRNENNYSLPYYDNYGDEIKAAYEPDSGVLPSNQSYSTHDWPIKILSSSDFIGTTNPNNTDSKNIIRISLPKGDNLNPLLYLNSGIRFGARRFPKFPKDKKKFVQPEFSGAALWSDELQFAIPNHVGLASTTSIAWYVQLTYIKRIDSGQIAGNTTVVETDHYLDNVFDIDMLDRFLDKTASVQVITELYERFIDAEDDLGFAYMAAIGIAKDNDRICWTITPKDYYINKVMYGHRTIKKMADGTGNESDLFKHLGRKFPEFAFKKRELNLTGPGIVNYMSFFRTATGNTRLTLPESWMGFCLETGETSALTVLANTAGIDRSLHRRMLAIDSTNHGADTNDDGYVAYTFKVRGIDGSGLQSNSANGAAPIYTDNGLLYSSHLAIQGIGGAASSPSNDLSYVGKPDGDSQNNPGQYLYRISRTSKRAEWKILNANGTLRNFSGLGNIYLPLGTRTAKLSRKRINDPLEINKNYVKIATIFKGAIRDGFIHEDAFITSLSPREYMPEADINPLYAVQAFVNDADYQIRNAETLLSTLSSEVYYNTMVSELRYSYIGKNSGGTVINPNALNFKFETAVAQLNLNNPVPFNTLKANLKTLRETFSHRINNGHGRQTWINMPKFRMSTTKPYTEDKLAASLEFRTTGSYSTIVNKRLSVAIDGKPTGGGFKLKYNSNESALLPHNATISQIKAELVAITGEAPSNVVEYVAFAYDPTDDEIAKYPYLKPGACHLIYATPSTSINPANLSVSFSNLSGGNNPVVHFRNRVIFPPLSYSWLSKQPLAFRNYFTSNCPLLDSTHINGGSTGEVFGYNGENTKFFRMLWEIKLLRDEISANYSTNVGTTPEGQWFLSMSNADLESVEVLIALSSHLWSDDKRNAKLNDFNICLWSSFVPMDQSIGYLNSNAWLSLMIHESDQWATLTSMRDTHGNHHSNIIWNALNSPAYANLEINQALSTIAGNASLGLSSQYLSDILLNFFQFQPLLSMFYLKDYASAFGI